MPEYIHTEEAPKAIGAYNQAVKTGNLVFLSGQIGLDPKTGQMISESFSQQTHQVFKNLAAVCRAAGGDLKSLVKINVFLADMQYFPEFNEIMIKYFADIPYPARSAVTCLGLPRNALVEIEAVMSLEF